MAREKRSATRKSVDSILVSDLTSLSSYSVLAKEGYIVDASTSGFLLVVSRKHLVQKELKQDLNMDKLVGQQVVLYLPQMNLDLDGRVTRTHHRGSGFFEVAIEFGPDVPKYWKECLIDLLPTPGEIGQAG
jgi:hypothetical protein